MNWVTIALVFACVVAATVSISHAEIDNQDILACRPDWDNQCDKDAECCSKYCKRDRPDWATGVCRQRGSDGTTTTSATSKKPTKNPTKKPTKSPKPTKTPTDATTATTSSSSQRGRGECSWYGEDGEIPPNSYTSCGDIFDRDAMKAAQLAGLRPKLPCGTQVRITNEANGKSVDVVINDSGTHEGRILDLTYAAFGKIEKREKGVTPCSYVVIN